MDKNNKLVGLVTDRDIRQAAPSEAGASYDWPEQVARSALVNALRKAARGTANLMPAIVDCVENYVTLGEICDTLRREFGEYRGGVSF